MNRQRRHMSAGLMIALALTVAAVVVIAMALASCFAGGAPGDPFQ